MRAMRVFLIVAAIAGIGSAGAQPVATLSQGSLVFAGPSMRTTSPSQAITLTNTGNATLNVASVSVSHPDFAQANNCTTLAPAATCTITLTFTPSAAPGAVNSTQAVSATLTVASDGSGSPNKASLSGTAEKSLVTHYYLSILRRVPDAGGKAFWQGEAARVAGLGASVNEVWYALAGSFYVSAEYAAFNRPNAGFVTDLFNTFFNRAPDPGGLAFWQGQLDQGLPREVALAAFMFSPEFASFTQAIFGNTAARAEVDAAGDYYRGLLGRLPDNGGFTHWIQRFRDAQCAGAAAVASQADQISGLFVGSAEYAARSRTNEQFVGDLYNAFLRRGGDLAGVQFWINQVASGARTREQVRAAFRDSAEFQGRVAAIVASGCVR